MRQEQTTRPQIELIPERAAVCHDADTELHVLVRISAPQLPQTKERPPLNIALVIDRSGSMSGAKLQAAKAASCFAVQQLQPSDRVSVTIYDDNVETLVPSTLAENKTSILRSIEQVRSGGSTDLHGGWVDGATQVGRYLDNRNLNRVLILTDGLANAGVTEPDKIVADVKALATRGVTTSTLGVGNDYNEDLLEAMAVNGDGNYYFIEGASDLERIFASELQGLMATLGHTVSLGIEPQNGAKVQDVLNDLTRNSFGRLQLPNLVAGNAIEVVVKLHIPAQRSETALCNFRLAWSSPNQAERNKERVSLSLPVVSSSEWHDLPKDERVTSQVELMNVTRIRESAVKAIERGEVDEVMDFLGAAGSVAAASPAAWAAEELREVEQLRNDLQSGERARALKFGKHSLYSKRRGR